MQRTLAARAFSACAAQGLTAAHQVVHHLHLQECNNACGNATMCTHEYTGTRKAKLPKTRIHGCSLDGPEFE
eukprot:925733-Pelagomonas_calceolata.AAC.2